MYLLDNNRPLRAVAESPAQQLAQIDASMPEPFDDFLHALYDGVLAVDSQRIWLGALRTLLGADMTAFLMAAPSGLCAAIVGDGFADGMDTAYYERYQYLDPLQKHLFSSPNRRVASDDPLAYDLDKKGEYYNDYLLRTEIRHCMHFCLEIGQSRIRITAMRRSDKEFTRDQARLMSGVSRHVEAAMRLKEAIDRKSSLAQSALAAFENVSFGFAIVSATGSVHHANSPMRRVLDSNPNLGIRNGKLTALSRPEHSALEQLIRRAAEATTGVGGFLRLGSGPASERVMVVVSHLPQESFWATTRSRSVAVFVSAPSRRSPWSESSPIRSAFGLTFAEARVAMLLAGGMPTPAIASELGVRTSTIRAHLKAIFAKTGTHSQAELLNMLFQSNIYNVGPL